MSVGCALVLKAPRRAPVLDTGGCEAANQKHADLGNPIKHEQRYNGNIWLPLSLHGHYERAALLNAHPPHSMPFTEFWMVAGRLLNAKPPDPLHLYNPKLRDT